MWADFLIALGLAVLGGAVVVVIRRRGGGPAERHRVRAIAAAIAPLPDLRNADEHEHVQEIHALYEQYRTDEFPTLAFDADPLGAPIPDGYRVEAEQFFHDLAADRLSAFTWTTAQRETVALASVPIPHVPTVEPFALEGPTGVFSKDWIDSVMTREAATR
ncbi:hypothetical protein ACQP1P_38820 [Dactylosporangium sp. CA-052675]|uniref:hypothetical protein n=1 Tax=Dactylosporangium sp. CA-052675 TaxID=3239927 RepID=UPI003D94D4BE